MIRTAAIITATEAEVKYHCPALIIYLQNKLKLARIWFNDANYALH